MTDIIAHDDDDDDGSLGISAAKIAMNRRKPRRSQTDACLTEPETESQPTTFVRWSRFEARRFRLTGWRSMHRARASSRIAGFRRGKRIG